MTRRSKEEIDRQGSIIVSRPEWWRVMVVNFVKGLEFYECAIGSERDALPVHFVAVSYFSVSLISSAGASVPVCGGTWRGSAGPARPVEACVDKWVVDLA